MTPCACILRNLLIDHTIPQDWMVDSNNLELDKEEELDNHSEMGNQHSQILANMLEIHQVTD